MSSVHRHVKTKSRSLLSPSETSAELEQSDLQRCIATVNSYSNHLGELRGLWEKHNHLLSSQPESKQRIDLIIQKAQADIEHCGMTNRLSLNMNSILISTQKRSFKDALLPALTMTAKLACGEN